jgi:hypothetical protein
MTNLLATCTDWLTRLVADYHREIFTCMAMVALLLIVALAIELMTTVRVEDFEPKEPGNE